MGALGAAACRVPAHAGHSKAAPARLGTGGHSRSSAARAPARARPRTWAALERSCSCNRCIWLGADGSSLLNESDWSRFSSLAVLTAVWALSLSLLALSFSLSDSSTSKCRVSTCLGCFCIEHSTLWQSSFLRILQNKCRGSFQGTAAETCIPNYTSYLDYLLQGTVLQTPDQYIKEHGVLVQDLHRYT